MSTLLKAEQVTKRFSGLLAVNKLDGTARGGAVLAIADQLELPVSVVGLGEGLDDWEPFDAEAFARGLFE